MLQKLINYVSCTPWLRLWAQRLYGGFSKYVHLLPPVGIAVELTYLCNWRCQMCFHHRPSVHDQMAATIRTRKNEELSTAEIKALIDDVARLGVKHISLHGGEPLLRPDFCELLAHAANYKLHTSTFSNATLITDEIADQLVRHLDDIGVSIHGVEAAHDLVTGIPGSFQKSVAGVQRLQAAKRRAQKASPRIHLTCIVSGLNYERLPEMVDVAKLLELDAFSCGMVTFTNEQASTRSCAMLGRQPPEPAPFLGDSLVSPDVLRVDPVRYQAAVANLLAAAAAAGIQVSVARFQTEKEIALAFSDPFFRLGKFCHYPWYSCAVSAYGDVYPCIQLSFLGVKMGNLREQPFAQIWRGPAYRAFRQAFLKHRCYLPVCAKCCFITDDQ